MPTARSPSRILYGLLLIATAINVLGLPIAVFQAEPWHATLHAGLALGCGYWALRLRHRRAAAAAQLSQEENPDEAGQPRELEAGDRDAMQDQWLRQERQRERQSRDD